MLLVELSGAIDRVCQMEETLLAVLSDKSFAAAKNLRRQYLFVLGMRGKVLVAGGATGVASVEAAGSFSSVQQSQQ